MKKTFGCEGLRRVHVMSRGYGGVDVKMPTGGCVHGVYTTFSTGVFLVRSLEEGGGLHKPGK